MGSSSGSIAQQQALQTAIVNGFSLAAWDANASCGDPPAADAALMQAVDEFIAATENTPTTPPKPKPVPTGIRPRLLLLPVVAFLITSIPVTAVYLPIFLAANEQRDGEMGKQISECVVYPTPPEVFLVSELLRRGLPVTPAQRRALNAYDAAMDANCTAVRPAQRLQCLPCALRLSAEQP